VPARREESNALWEWLEQESAQWAFLDQAWNRISLCAAHHLNGVHMGWIKVSGTAPDELRWKLGRP